MYLHPCHAPSLNNYSIFIHVTFSQYSIFHSYYVLSIQHLRCFLHVLDSYICRLSSPHLLLSLIFNFSPNYSLHVLYSYPIKLENKRIILKRGCQSISFDTISQCFSSVFRVIRLVRCLLVHSFDSIISLSYLLSPSPDSVSLSSHSRRAWS